VRPQVVEVIRAVEAVTGVTGFQIMSADRHQSIAMARMLTYWLCRRHRWPMALSYKELGRELGRDSTTVMHGVGRIETLLDEGDEWACGITSQALRELGIRQDAPVLRAVGE
jgi:chromosomal replication initiation ATPase DnaA